MRISAFFIAALIFDGSALSSRSATLTSYISNLFAIYWQCFRRAVHYG
jgi:hypothetical protein